MRIRGIPPFTGRSLEVALASKVLDTLHIGTVVSNYAHWMLSGRRTMQLDPCAGKGPAGCRVVTQVKMLGHFLSIATKAGYKGEITVLTANRAVEALVNAWHAGEKPSLGWYNGDAEGKRRPIYEYSGRLTAVFTEPQHGGLVDLAWHLNNLLTESGQTHEAVGARARQLLYENLGIG